MRTPHSSGWPGKRVRIKLKDGRTFITRFRDKKGTTIITDAGKFAVGDSAIIYDL